MDQRYERNIYGDDIVGNNQDMVDQDVINPEANLDEAESIGALNGAVTGAMIGAPYGVFGAVIGGLSGGVIGNQLIEEAEEEDDETAPKNENV